MLFSRIAHVSALTSLLVLSACGERDGAEALARLLMQTHRDGSMAAQEAEARFGKTLVLSFRTREAADMVLSDARSRCRARHWQATMTDRSVDCQRRNGTLNLEVDAERDGWSRVTVTATQG